MRAGKLRHRINIEQPATGQDALGQPATGWDLVAAVWADIQHQSGLQAVKADSDVSVVKSSIRIRYRTGLNAGMRVVYGAEIYDIKAVLPDGRKQYIDLVCERVE